MSRLKSRAVGGYFATPSHLVERIAALVYAKLLGRYQRWSFVDPCAGDGAALVALARAMVGVDALKNQTTLYAAELERSRARRLDATLGAVVGNRAKVLHGDAMRVQFWPEKSGGTPGLSAARGGGTPSPHRSGIDLCDSPDVRTMRDDARVLFLNPPYDHDPIYGRLEERFLRCFTPVLGPRGVLFFVVPFHALAASAATLATHFEDIRVLRFPAGDWEAFKQVVLVARRAPALGAPDAAMEGMLKRWAADPSQLAELPEADEAREDPRRLVVTSHEQYEVGPARWALRPLDAALLSADYDAWGASRGHDAAATVLPMPGVVPDTAGAIGAQSFPLAVVPKAAHIAAGVAAGLFNGCRVEPTDAAAREHGLPPLLVKGSFDRPWKHVRGADKVNGDGAKVAEQQVQRPELVVTVLDLATARYHTLANDAAITRPEPGVPLDVARLTVGDLIEHYGPALLAAMRARCPVLHDAANPAHQLDLVPMARTPFEAQRQSIMATTKVLDENGAAIVLAEVGTGKTTVACGVVAQRDARRALVMCPPHLLESWQKEVAACQPDARVVVLGDTTDVDSLAADTSPGVVYGVLSREMAKLGHAHASLTGRCPRCNALLPAGDHGRRRAVCKATTRRAGNKLAEAFDLLATAIALEPAEVIARTKIPAAEVRNAVASEVVRRALANRDTRGRKYPENPRSTLALDRRLAGVVRILAEVYAGGGRYSHDYHHALSPMQHVFHAIGSMDVCAAVALALWKLALATPEPKDSYGNSRNARADLAREALDMMSLVDPSSAASVDGERAMAAAAREAGVARVGAVAVEWDKLTELSRRRESFLQGHAVSFVGSVVGAHHYAWSWNTLTQAFTRSGTNASPSLAHLRDAFASLERTGVWYESEPCGERLYSAIPEPRRYPIATYISRRHSKLFDLVVLDEVQELTTDGSAQERAAHRLADLGVPVVALTGSIMNGYAESLFTTLWYLSRRFRAVYRRDERRRFVEDCGYRRRQVQYVEKSSGKVVPFEFGAVSDRRVDVQERELGDAPGVLPVAILRYLLPIAVTMHKADLALDLPSFEECPVEIEPDDVLERTHRDLQIRLVDQIKRDTFTPMRGKLFGALSELPSHPDRATNDTGNAELLDADGRPDPSGARVYEIRYPEAAGAHLVARATGRDAGALLPKEAWLLDKIEAELAEGRRVLVAGYHEEVLPRLAKIISARIGEPVPLLLSGKVPTAKRQSWIDREVIAKGRRVMVVNPVVVQTGLNNLVWFSTGVWVENPACNPLVKRQFEGRLHRIGQKLPVRVFFPVYARTTQVQLRQLLADKVVVSMAVDGLDVEGALAAAGAVELDTSAGFGVGRQLYRILTEEAAA